MEESKNKLTVIVLLVIIILGLGGYIFYDKILSKDNETDVSENSNSYKMFANNLKNALANSDDYYYQYVESNCVDEGYSVSLKSNGELHIDYNNTDLSSEFNDYKIASNVLLFSVVPVGNGGCNMLFYINENGTVSSADTEFLNSNKKIKIEDNIGNYKNIVSIKSGMSGGISSASKTMFIDINGNTYK